MLDFHKDKERYFNMQHWTARDFIIPFLSQHMELKPTLKVLEIGCAEAGVLKAFIETGHHCTGIELSDTRIDTATFFQKEAVESGQLKFLNKDIYLINIKKDLGHKFDLILLKDVIEHIPNQEKIIPKLNEFLAPGGKIFYAFPPWQMPFGGHQQVARNKFLRFLPWIHLFPRSVYRGLLTLFGEKPEVIKELLEIKDTGISIERFERIIRDSDSKIIAKEFHLINPIYKYKFNLNKRVQFRVISKIPWFRNFVTTGVYYLVAPKH